MPKRSIIHTMKKARKPIQKMHPKNVPMYQRPPLNISRRQSGMVKKKAKRSGKPKNQKNLPTAESGMSSGLNGSSSSSSSSSSSAASSPSLAGFSPLASSVRTLE